MLVADCTSAASLCTESDPDLDVLVHRLVMRAGKEADHGDQSGNGAQKAEQPQRDGDVHRQHAPLHVLRIGHQSEQHQQKAEHDRDECVPEMRLDVAGHTDQRNQDAEDHRKLSHIDLQDR